MIQWVGVQLVVEGHKVFLRLVVGRCLRSSAEAHSGAPVRMQFIFGSRTYPAKAPMPPIVSMHVGVQYALPVLANLVIVDTAVDYQRFL